MKKTITILTIAITLLTMASCSTTTACYNGGGHGFRLTHGHEDFTTIGHFSKTPYGDHASRQKASRYHNPNR